MNWLQLRAMLAPLQQGAQGLTDTARFVAQEEVAPRLQSAWQSIRGMLPNMPVQARNTNVPYWMVPQADGSTGAAPVSMQAPQQQTNAPAPDPFDEIAAETAKRENIVRQLGDFSKRVLTNSALIGD